MITSYIYTYKVNEKASDIQYGEWHFSIGTVQKHSFHSKQRIRRNRRSTPKTEHRFKSVAIEVRRGATLARSMKVEAHYV